MLGRIVADLDELLSICKAQARHCNRLGMVPTWSSRAVALPFPTTKLGCKVSHCDSQVRKLSQLDFPRFAPDNRPSTMVHAAKSPSEHRPAVQRQTAKGLAEEAKARLASFWSAKRQQQICHALLEHFLPLTVSPGPSPFGRSWVSAHGTSAPIMKACFQCMMAAHDNDNP